MTWRWFSIHRTSTTFDIRAEAFSEVADRDLNRTLKAWSTPDNGYDFRIFRFGGDFIIVSPHKGIVFFFFRMKE